MKEMTIRQSRKKGILYATGTNARFSAKHKMSLSNMSTMITSKRIAKTSPVTGRHAAGKRNHSKPNICWSCICAGTLAKSHINAV